MPARASEQDGTHPRPQLLREHWTDLSGPWQFAHDDAEVGTTDRWQAATDLADRSVFGRDTTVPFPPESAASGIGDTAHHKVVWYRRALPLADVTDLAAVRKRGHRLVLRFGAVDHRASAWLDGMLLATHEGGQTPWSVDLTDALDLTGDGSSGAGGPTTGAPREHVLVVRAEDDPVDLTQPRGKQDWQEQPHAIWYQRTTGIWQPVWLEVVPPVGVERLTWTPDLAAGVVRLAVVLTAAPPTPVTLSVRLDLAGQVLAEQSVRVTARRTATVIAVPDLRNGQGQQDLWWSPEAPRLVDADVRLLAAAGQGEGQGGEQLDAVTSYLGLRDAAVAGGAFVLNGHPVYVRSVLEQGYWPQTHLAAPDAAALRREVELILALGFNAVRVHQKVEDPRFLHWCDRLGLMVWGETANAFEFSPEAVRRLTTEWLDVVARDAGHPCIVTWVPVNESWGVQQIELDPAQRAYATALAELTRAVDPSRPVVSNDGWEHTSSDLLTIHDYADTGAVLTARYGSRAGVDEVLAGPGPAGRRILAGDTDRGQPVMLTEFGGVRFIPDDDTAGDDTTGAEERTGTWGYSTATDPEDFAARLTDLLSAVHASPVLAGFCYTQLTDTLQEANGLLDDRRRPKLPVERIRAIITGTPAAGS